MRAVGDKQRGTIRPDFDRSISIDFQGAKITSDTGFLVMREMDQRFNILDGAASKIDDPRSPRHTDHTLLQLLRQRVCQVAAGYEDCNDRLAERRHPTLRLALGNEHEDGAGQSALCRFENYIPATSEGLKALEEASAVRLGPCCGAETNGDSSQMSIPPKTPFTERKRAQPSTVTSSNSATIHCFASPATEISWAQDFDPETPIRLMGLSTLSLLLLSATCLGSNSSGSGGMQPSRAQMSTSSAKRSGSLISSVFPATTA